jgi:two-component system sensor histidine kinase PilS (NtrC family)
MASDSGWHEATESPAKSYWRSLHFFNIYRLATACVFLMAALSRGWTGVDEFTPEGLVLPVSITYLGLSFVFLVVMPRTGFRFNLQLTVEVLVDIVVLTLLMHGSGGTRSGFGYMLLVVLAAAGLVGQGRLTLFYAAVATLAVLSEQSYRALRFTAEAADFVHTGSISLGFFGTAITARLLARRVTANEELAARRGAALADQMHINQQVIRDMQDGVLVVDTAGQVAQFNPQAAILLAVKAPARGDLSAFSPVLAERYSHWRNQGSELSEAIRIPGNGRLLRARYLPAAASGHALIYLEDLDRVHARTQEIKLAALGRLTANMAHEIRNPLSAISHAAELLGEGGHPETQERLTRIITDNTQRLNHLVAEVLELGRRDQAKPETIRLAGFLETFVDDLTLRDERARQAVVLEVPAESVTCFDRGHFNRILWNLIANALRYCTGAAGSIRVRVAPAVGGAAELHVSDDGPGIDPKLRGQVFEPFFTTYSQGTGLGLYIARELCEANRATLVLLDDAPGAHFCLTLRGEPCPQEPSEKAAATLVAS